MVAGKVNNWAFDTVPQAGLNGRIGYQPRGKGLGGSSAINAMVYIRGHRSDYDQWASLGNPGWSFADVLPYFKRSEDNADFGGEYHGKGGPLARQQTAHRQSGAADLSAGGAAKRSFASARISTPTSTKASASTRSPRRTASAGARRAPISIRIMATRANLRVETDAHATRILFEGKRAVGVEYRQGKEIKQIRARREVILASGAFQTPQLLMLSGVGDSAALGKHGIAQRASSARRRTEPAGPSGFRVRLHVGQSEFQRHLARRHCRGCCAAIGQYRRERRGPMTSNFAECGGFLKTRPDLDVPDIQLHFGMAMVDDHGRKRHRGTGFTCHVCLLRPKSRGSVALASADPMAAPLIDPNFFGEPADLETMVAGFKITRRLLETPALRALQNEGHVHRRRAKPTTTSAPSCAPASTPSITRSAPARWGNDPLAVVDPKLQGSRPRRPARRRCLDHADPDRRQHQRADHHDRREGRRHDQGGDAGELIGRRHCRRSVSDEAIQTASA